MSDVNSRLPKSWTKGGKISPVFAGKKIIDYIKEHGKTTIEQLSSALNLKKGTVATTVSYLRIAKLVVNDKDGISLKKKSKKAKRKREEQVGPA